MAKAAKTFYEVTEDMAYKSGFTSDKSILQRRKEAARRTAREKKYEAKQRARAKLPVMPDEKSEKLRARRLVSKRRAERTGRASTILSSNRQTLG